MDDHEEPSTDELTDSALLHSQLTAACEASKLAPHMTEGTLLSVNLSIEDSGIGMNGDKVQSTFEPFSQANSSISRDFGGTGLGLPICKTIAELMNGSISVASEVGTWSTFTARLMFQSAAENNTKVLKPLLVTSPRLRLFEY